MNAAFMGEGIGPDNRLIQLHTKPGNGGQRPRCAGDFGRINARFERVGIAACAHGHHQLLQRGIARPFPNAIDGAFHLARTRIHPGQ